MGPPWTIKALLTWTTKFLSEKSIESPRLEAELLLAHALHCKRIDLIMRLNEEPDDAAKAIFRELVRRRADHWPTAYLIGTREFFLLPFEVSPATLIPRPDTETLVMAALEHLKVHPQSRVLDLGTGSGCISVSLAKNAPGIHVIAVDASPDALAVARRNAEAHGVAARIDFRRGDLFAPVTGEQFDVIVSNPPYIAFSEWDSLSEEVRDHEPRMALDGGPDGLAFYRRIAAEAPNYLNPNGVVMVEIGDTQANAVCALFGTDKVQKDAAGRTRVVTSSAGR